MINNTITYYNNNSNEYFDNTKNVNLTHLYNEFLKGLSEGSEILDLGCGSGRDSLYFKNQGYQVTALDGSKELAAKASELIGKEVLVMKFEDINITEKFHGIWACASLLHVKRDNILQVVNNVVNNNLEYEGVFYMSFKYGENEYIDEHGRYFNCYTEETFKMLIDKVEGLTIEKILTTEDVIPGRESLVWLNVIAKKNNICMENNIRV